MTKPTTVAIDLAKAVFEVAVSRRPGVVSSRRRLTRSQMSRFLAIQEPSLIVMEACGTAHHWGRQAVKHGHLVRLLPPHAIRPYVLRNKTDEADAKAILEANRNEAIRPVPIKSIEQQAISGLHRLRSAWMSTRTARINTVRGLLREIGITIPVGARNVVPHVTALLSEDESEVPEALRQALADAADEIRLLELRIRDIERKLEALARESEVITRLRTIPGIGLLTATALAGSLGDVHRFPSGRHLASSIGLTPREFSSGNTRRLGRISKQGDPYLRMLLIHGARTVLLHAKRNPKLDRLRAWALERQRVIGHNKAAVALANKMARIVWAVWRSERPYEPRCVEVRN